MAAVAASPGVTAQEMPEKSRRPRRSDRRKGPAGKIAPGWRADGYDCQLMMSGKRCHEDMPRACLSVASMKWGMGFRSFQYHYWFGPGSLGHAIDPDTGGSADHGVRKPRTHINASIRVPSLCCLGNVN